MAMKKSIVHIDDHLLFAEGIKLLFDGHPDYELSKHYENSAEAFEYCKLHKPDLVLMDYYLPEGNGLDAAGAYLKLNPKPLVVILTMVSDLFIVQAARSRGISGFLSKNIGHGELFSAIDAVINGGTCFPGTAEGTIGSKDLMSLLSNRERQIAGLVAQGYSTARIAQDLFISELTVSTHRKNILRKLNLENSVQLGNYIHLFR